MSRCALAPTARGSGRTRPSSRQRFVDIEVSDKAITTGHIHGDEIRRGLALHELGHHVRDFAVRGFRTTRGIALPSKDLATSTTSWSTSRLTAS